MSPLQLLNTLIACRSITPLDAGCQPIIAERLKKLNFHIEHMRFNAVDNLWARNGTASPLVVFVGHTDVVPPGPLDKWKSDPFTPTVEDGFLYGRGAADMKTGLAAMVIAAEEFLKKHPHYPGSIAFLITSDEEGLTNKDGTQKVVEKLIAHKVKIDYCIVGEATSDTVLGDQIRIGRRGSLSGKLTIYGKQGHVAFPQLAQNPIFLFAPALAELSCNAWDEGNAFFPKTTFQISNLHAGEGAHNVIPGSLEMLFNFRFGTASTAYDLETKFTAILQKHRLNFDITWTQTGHPYLTQAPTLIQATKKAITEITGLETKLSTGGGTSDGRFLAAIGAEVIELGPIHSTVHQINERVRIEDVNLLKDIYIKILEYLFNVSHVI